MKLMEDFFMMLTLYSKINITDFNRKIVKAELDSCYYIWSGYIPKCNKYEKVIYKTIGLYWGGLIVRLIRKIKNIKGYRR